ncbi:hypothetical protein ZOSMA_14G01810 [Zostera marina]|uniref:S1 motif domain-containing protein n=1 Tax=Zostera marina TaxID=29655 RepID=A0A0K9PWI8_ZOSMR|nr:hypothetical protein ZOSMA_14G01810 [Zostera marina]
MKDTNFKKKAVKHKPEKELRTRKGTPFKKSVPLMMKKQKSEANSIPPEIAASLLAGEDNVPDFPRGGASVLSRSELAQARTEAELDFEVEKMVSKKRKEKNKGEKKIPGHGWEEDWASLYGEGISGKLPRFANRITSKNISPNMKLWGVVSEVNTKDFVITLPGGLKGIVHPEDSSDIFSDYKYKDFESKILGSIVHVGQLVPCIVKQVDDGKKERKGSIRIMLSIRLSLLHKGLSLSSVQDGMVINAYVKTIEDHGYILSFGLSSFSGFLPKKSQDGRELILKIGQLTKGSVKNIDKARSVVFLSSDNNSVSTNAVKDLKGLSVDALVPGMMVNARVHAILENGIMLSFLTYFTGTVDIFHMQSIFPKKSWKEDYYQNKKVLITL